MTTPTGRTYTGLRYCAGNCAVSLVRSGEAMEKAVQDCCRSMRIGKILVESDPDSGAAHVVFAKLPDDIASRQVRPVPVLCCVQNSCRCYSCVRSRAREAGSAPRSVLSFPQILLSDVNNGKVRVLLEHGVPQEKITLINLFCTPAAASRCELRLYRVDVK